MTKQQTLKIISYRYSEQQLMKAQDIIGDLRDELKEVNSPKNDIDELDNVFRPYK